MFLVVTNLSKKYKDGTEALNGISFKIKKGSFIALTGPSGSGKTTLIKCLNSSLTPTSGVIRLEGMLLFSPLKNFPDRRAKVATIYQDFRLVEQLSVLKNVLIGSLANHQEAKNLFGLFSKSKVLEAENLLKSLEIFNLKDKKNYQLSGGERQRVSVARAMMQKPRLLLADEPISNLDKINAEKVLSLIKELSSKSKTTIIFSTHNISMARKYADRIVNLRKGRVVYFD